MTPERIVELRGIAAYSANGHYLIEALDALVEERQSLIASVRSAPIAGALAMADELERRWLVAK